MHNLCMCAKSSMVQSSPEHASKIDKCVEIDKDSIKVARIGDVWIESTVVVQLTCLLDAWGGYNAGL